MKNCTGTRCPMQSLKVNTIDPATCEISDCPFRTKPFTNADCIRSMTDEELAKFLCGLFPSSKDCGECIASELCSFGHNGFAEWVNQEADDADK